MAGWVCTFSSLIFVTLQFDIFVQIEFADKKKAKRVARMLNGTPMGTSCVHRPHTFMHFLNVYFLLHECAAVANNIFFLQNCTHHNITICTYLNNTCTGLVRLKYTFFSGASWKFSVLSLWHELTTVNDETSSTIANFLIGRPCRCIFDSFFC